MTAAEIASWFAKSGLVFVVSYSICWGVPRAFDNIPEFPPTTTDQEQTAVFDAYFRRPTPTIAIVGSSLAFRLKEEYFAHTSIENVAIPGGSPLTGLEIIERATKRKPRVIAVETNILSRGVDDALVNRYQASTLPAEPLRPFRALAASFEPKPIVRKPLDAAERNALLRSSPAPMLPLGQNIVADAIVEFNKPAYDAIIGRDAATLKTLVNKLTVEGVKIYLFELPMSPEIARTRFFETERSEISKLFEPTNMLRLSCETCDLHWDDGSHLDERSALIIAAKLEQMLTVRVSDLEGR